MLRSTVVLLCLSLPLTVSGQTTPPGTGVAQTPSAHAESAANPPSNGCDSNSNFVNQRWYFPLNFKGATGASVGCFFASNGPVTPITSVDFQYGFGSSSSSISADAIALKFAEGFQVSFGSSVSGAGTNPSAATTSTTSSSISPILKKRDTTTPTTTTTGQETPSQALQQLQNGGDFYLRAIYPILYGTHTGDHGSLSGFVVTVPRVGFNVQGVSAQTTLTDTTEYNINAPIEAYGTIGDTENKGALYADGKTGYQYVTPDFATAVGLPGKNSFLISSLSMGVQIFGFARIGFLYTKGPAQFTSSGSDEFNRWHLAIQLNPAKAFATLQ